MAKVNDMTITDLYDAVENARTVMKLVLDDLTPWTTTFERVGLWLEEYGEESE